MKKVFVLGITEKDGKYLLLNRINPPRVWSPPGGWLEEGERPEDGLLREVKEETGLEVEVISPFLILSKNKGNTLGLVYICRYLTGKVQMSHEHNGFMWKTLKEIKEEQIKCSPSVSDLEQAEKILNCL